MKVVTSFEMSKIESKALFNGGIDAEFMEEAGCQVAPPALRVVEGIDIVRLKPAQAENLYGEHHHRAQGESFVPEPAPMFRAFAHQRLGH